MMNSVINYYQNTFFSFGVNFAEINMETLPCFSERSKKIPNGKHAFERGEKKIVLSSSTVAMKIT